MKLREIMSGFVLVLMVIYAIEFGFALTEKPSPIIEPVVTPIMKKVTPVLNTIVLKDEVKVEGVVTREFATE